MPLYRCALVSLSFSAIKLLTLASVLTIDGILSRSDLISDQVLPESCKILVSPARRCLQTMEALDRKYRLCPEIAPDAGMEALLQASNWPHAKGPIMLVGHQPDLGTLAGQLLFGHAVSLGVRKASVWWLASREDEATGVLRAVMSPELAPK